MPGLTSPWRTLARAVPEREYLTLLSYLPLRRRRKVPHFMRLARAVQGQLARSEGVIGYSLRAQPVRARFWTLSAWEDQEALDAFVRELPHAEVMTELAGDMGATSFTTWTSLGAELPPRWTEALARGGEAASGGT